MALTQLTKVDGGGISTTSDYRVGIITASKFVGPFDGTSGNISGVVTASTFVGNGDFVELDVDGHTNLDNVSIAGVVTAGTINATSFGAISGSTATFTGNVSIGGTLTYEDVTNIDSVGIITARNGINVSGGNVTIAKDIDVDGHTNLDNVSIAGVTTFSGDVYANEGIFLPDTKALKIGNTEGTPDFTISHDTSNTILDNNTGDLILRGDGDDVKILAEDDIVLRDNDDSTNFLHCVNGGAVNLYFSGTKKFETTTDGAKVTGVSGNARFNQFGHLLLQNTNNGTTNFWGISPRGGGELDIGYAAMGSGGQSTTISGDVITLGTNSTATFHGNIDANGDLDVDGHTNLDNVSIAGVTTTTGFIESVGTSGRGAKLGGLSVGYDSLYATIQPFDGNFLHLNYSAGTHVKIGALSTKVDLEVNGDVTPKTDSARDLGLTGKRWRNVYADTLYGDGSNLTSLPTQVTINNNADNRVITGGSGVNLYAESGFTFDGTDVQIPDKILLNTNGTYLKENQFRFGTSGTGYIDHFTTGQSIIFRLSNSSSLDSTVLEIDHSGVSFQDKNITNVGTIACDSLKGDADDNTNITFAGSDVITFKAGNTSPALTINTTQVKVEDDQKITIGTGNDFTLWHNQTHSLIKNTTGRLYVLADDLWFKNQADNSSLARFLNGDTSIFYFAGNEKLRTSATGATVIGELAATQDYPDIRPTLDFNFAATKKLDSRISYHRSGPASYHDEFGKVVLVGADAPRFDHTFPEYWDEGNLGESNSRGISKGLLIERSRTNLYKNNHNLTTVNDHGGITQTINTTETTAPDGTFTATKFTVTGSDQWSRWDSNNGLDIVGINFTDIFSTSIYMKTVGTSNVNVAMDFGDRGGKTFSVGQEWKRYAISDTHHNYGGSTKFIDIVFNGSVYIWGLQCENGENPSSYIPTRGSSETRGDEYVVIDGQDFTDFYNPVESSLLMVGTMHQTHNAQGQLNIAHIGNNNNDGHGIFREHGTRDVWYHIRNNNSTPSGGNINPNGFGDWDENEEARIAIAFKNGDQAISVNGGNQVTATVSSNYPTANITKMWIGSAGNGSFFNGIISRIAYYPKQLTDSQLNTLTA